MFEGKLTKSLKNQICCKTQFKEGNIKIDVVPVRQEQNGFHCCAYAIGFMVFLVNKKDLTSKSFDEKKLQVYLYDCYKKGRLMPFLSAKKNLKSNTLKYISFELFCIWQMSWAKQNRRSVELKMAETIVVWSGSIEDFTLFHAIATPSPYGDTYDVHQNCPIFKTPHPLVHLRQKILPPP